MAYPYPWDTHCRELLAESPFTSRPTMTDWKADKEQIEYDLAIKQEYLVHTVHVLTFYSDNSLSLYYLLIYFEHNFLVSNSVLCQLPCRHVGTAAAPPVLCLCTWGSSVRASPWNLSALTASHITSTTPTPSTTILLRLYPGEHVSKCKQPLAKRRGGHPLFFP